MAGSAIQVRSKEEVVTENTSLRARLARLRSGGDKAAQRVQQIATQGAVAFVVGAYRADRKANGADLATIGGLDPLLTWSLAGYFAAPMIGGKAGEVVEAGSAALISAYAYEAGLNSRSGR